MSPSKVGQKSSSLPLLFSDQSNSLYLGWEKRFQLESSNSVLNCHQKSPQCLFLKQQLGTPMRMLHLWTFVVRRCNLGEAVDLENSQRLPCIPEPDHSHRSRLPYAGAKTSMARMLRTGPSHRSDEYSNHPCYS